MINSNTVPQSLNNSEDTTHRRSLQSPKEADSTGFIVPRWNISPKIKHLNFTYFYKATVLPPNLWHQTKQTTLSTSRLTTQKIVRLLLLLQFLLFHHQGVPQILPTLLLKSYRFIQFSKLKRNLSTKLLLPQIILQKWPTTPATPVNTHTQHLPLALHIALVKFPK